MNRIFKNVSRGKNMSCLLLSLCLFLCIGCSEDEGEFDFPLDGSNLSMDDIAGSWTAIFAEFQQLSDPNSNVEIVSQGGSMTLNIQSNGRFTSTISVPGGSSEQFSGQLGFSGAQLVLLDDADEPGDEAFLGIALTSEDVLELNGILEFDFDGNGSFEETVVVLRMIR
ncbi:hypothetical protein [Flagellimonas sp.]|uniref:hypothetical protein n=1 Tax=Flagellimonas sp. TaxID=2058762 RepID=UPI003F4A57A4